MYQQVNKHDFFRYLATVKLTKTDFKFNKKANLLPIVANFLNSGNYKVIPDFSVYVDIQETVENMFALYLENEALKKQVKQTLLRKPSLNPNETYRVYKNLTKKCWSVQHKKTRKVVAYLDFFVMEDCKFIVSEKGRQRVIADSKKNVHAFVEGKIKNTTNKPIVATNNIVTYNPYKKSFFYLKDQPQKPLTTLSKMFFSDEGVCFKL